MVENSYFRLAAIGMVTKGENRDKKNGIGPLICVPDWQRGNLKSSEAAYLIVGGVGRAALRADPVRGLWTAMRSRHGARSLRITLLQTCGDPGPCGSLWRQAGGCNEPPGEPFIQRTVCP